MSETPPEFDLKFLPDWLKEGSASTTAKYANYEGEREDRRGGDRGPRREGGFGGGGGRGRPGFGGPGGGDRRGPRPGGGAPGGGGPRGDRNRPGGGGGPRGGGDRRGPGGQQQRPVYEPRQQRPAEPRPAPTPPVQVKIEFLPEPNGAIGITQQIKKSARAYPLFGAGRLFLERPERHRVRISSIDPTVVLYQVGDGPISLDQAFLEKNAFKQLKDEYYKEETVQGEEIKGKFSNVARSRSTGIYLGPTSYHSYQPGLRRLYEERFSRRMSFQDFLYQDVEIRTDELSINEWKEQARSSTTYTTLKEPEPITFKTLAEAEQHFRAHYSSGVVKAGLSLECSGQASRQIADRSIANALRDAWERERGFPVQLVNNLRPYLTREGLHFFKHRKRILYVSAVRPARHVAGQVFSSGFAGILNAIEESPKITRKTLANKVLGKEQAESPESTDAKEALARDLLYLIHQGHVIEFADGTLDLPLTPKAAQQQQGAAKGGKGGAAATGAVAAEGVSAEDTEEADVSPEALAQAATDEGLSPDAPIRGESTVAEGTATPAPIAAVPVPLVSDEQVARELAAGGADISSTPSVPPQAGVGEPSEPAAALPPSGFGEAPAEAGLSAAENLAAPSEHQVGEGEARGEFASTEVAAVPAVITDDVTPEQASLPPAYSAVGAKAPSEPADAGLGAVGALHGEPQHQAEAATPAGDLHGEQHAAAEGLSGAGSLHGEQASQQ